MSASTGRESAAGCLEAPQSAILILAEEPWKTSHSSVSQLYHEACGGWEVRQGSRCPVYDCQLAEPKKISRRTKPRKNQQDKRSSESAVTFECSHWRRLLSIPWLPYRALAFAIPFGALYVSNVRQGGASRP